LEGGGHVESTDHSLKVVILRCKNSKWLSVCLFLRWFDIKQVFRLMFQFGYLENSW